MVKRRKRSGKEVETCNFRHCSYQGVVMNPTGTINVGTSVRGNDVTLLRLRLLFMCRYYF